MQNFENPNQPDLIKRISGEPGERLPSSDAVRKILPTLVEGLTEGVAIGKRSGASAPLSYVNRAFEQLTGVYMR